MLLAMFVVSMYFFPFNFTAFPSQPTKNYLAVLGIGFMIFTFLLKGNIVIPKEVVVLLLFAGGVSMVSYISVVINGTPDYSYVTYIRSAIIWLAAAYVPVMLIWFIHGYIDGKLIVNYLVAVCLFQCLMAMLINFVPAVQMFVDRHVSQGQAMLQEMGRLYGIGAYLDVGGSRFAVVLVSIAAVVNAELKEMKMPQLIFYGLSFVIITVVGNIIARTTIVGTVLGILLFVFRYFRGLLTGGFGSMGKLMWSMVVVLAIMIPTAVSLYRAFPAFQDLMEFGFEGFFNFFGGGDFETASTNTLKSMVVFPEDLNTWIIGDGYFANSRYDENYLGDATTGGFYMGTDIGYLRFIFYAGLIGLFAMAMVIIYAAITCINKIPDYKMVFILAAATNFVVWAKVATDLFLFFCRFSCAVIVDETYGVKDGVLEEEDGDDLLEESEGEDIGEVDEEDDEEPEAVPVFHYPGMMK